MPIDRDILYPALRLAGILTGAGHTEAPEDLTDGLIALNGLVDAWSTQRLLVYTIRADRYPVTPSQASYTIGPGGDFDAPRPTRITAANFVLTTGGETHLPLRMLTVREWAQKALQVVPTSVPTEIYNDGAFPVSRLYLWGYPTEGHELELFTWQQATKFESLDEEAAFPPGYQDAVTYNLAVRLSGQYGTALRPDVAQIARETKGAVKALNAASPAIASADYGAGAGSHGGGFNYLTGQRS